MTSGPCSAQSPSHGLPPALNLSVHEVSDNGAKAQCTENFCHLDGEVGTSKSAESLPGQGDGARVWAQPGWSKEKEKILCGPFNYIFGHPGKGQRSYLIAALNRWLKIPDESLQIITRVIEMLHTASLL